jgi:hypothetical protein
MINAELCVVAAKEETVEGTSVRATLANTDGFLAFNPVFTPNVDMVARNPVRDTFSKYPSASGIRSGQISFDMEMTGSGAPATPPTTWGPLLKWCGFAQTIQSNISVTYKPASAGIKTCTVAMYNDGKLKAIWGARGKVIFDFEVGKPPIAHFTFIGADHEELDTALLSGVTYEAKMPPILLATVFTVDSYAAAVSKVTLDMGIVLARRIDWNKSSGAVSYAITGRDPKGSFDPEEVVIAANYDFLLKWKTPGTLGIMTFKADGGAGNTLTVTMPKVRYTGLKETIREGIKVLNMEFEPTFSTGDDEVSLIHS